MKDDKQIQQLNREEEEEQSKAWEAWLEMYKTWLRQQGEKIPEVI